MIDREGRACGCDGRIYEKPAFYGKDRTPGGICVVRGPVREAAVVTEGLGDSIHYNITVNVVSKSLQEWRGLYQE